MQAEIDESEPDDVEGDYDEMTAVCSTLMAIAKKHGGETATEKYAKRLSRPVNNVMETQHTPQLALKRKKVVKESIKRRRVHQATIEFRPTGSK